MKVNNVDKHSYCLTKLSSTVRRKESHTGLEHQGLVSEWWQF